MHTHTLTPRTQNAEHKGKESCARISVSGMTWRPVAGLSLLLYVSVEILLLQLVRMLGLQVSATTAILKEFFRESADWHSSQDIVTGHKGHGPCQPLLHHPTVEMEDCPSPLALHMHTRVPWSLCTDTNDQPRACHVHCFRFWVQGHRYVQEAKDKTF